MLDALIAALQHAGSDPSGRDIAEMLWLRLLDSQSLDSLDQPRVSHVGSVPEAALDAADRPSEAAPHTSVPSPLPTDQPPSPQPAHPRPDQEHPTRFSLQGASPPSGETQLTSGISMRIPAVTPLPGSREIGRALRPLKRRVVDRRLMILDEQATAQRSAAANALIPVLRSQCRRWLAVDLVVDQSRSMVIWRDMVAEFRLLLIRQGSFRHIRVWSLDTTDPAVPLYAGMGLGQPHGTPRSPHELRDALGERLILLLTDCVAPTWRDGTVSRRLCDWGQVNPVTILHVLPPHLWKTTALGKELSAAITATHPNTPNRKLHAHVSIPPFARRLHLDQKPGIAIPVVSLNALALNRWARMLCGDSRETVRGVFLLLPSPEREVDEAQPQNKDRDITQPSQGVSGQERADQFLYHASSPARILAYYLSWSPVLTLPVIRLIQAALVPDARHEHVAEVLLGGLLYQYDPHIPANLDEIVYVFYDGVRAYLQSGVSVSRSGEILRLLQGDSAVIEQLSAYLAGRTGYASDTTAIVQTLTTLARPIHISAHAFATLEQDWFRRMGVEDVTNLMPAGTGPTADPQQSQHGPNDEWPAAYEMDLADLLLACPSMADRRSRTALVTLLSDTLHRQWVRDASERQDVLNLIKTCRDTDAGLDLLIELVAVFDRDTRALQTLQIFWTSTSGVRPQAHRPQNLSSQLERALRAVPQELLGSASAAVSYLQQLSEDGARPLMEAKVILVGDATAGKTSLVTRLLHDRYDSAESKTEGIATARWSLLLDSGEVRLNVWDFGGQEIMHATHQFFLTKRSVYLLVINCRASDHDNRLDYWLKLVESYAPDSPVIVVGNKADQAPLNLDQRGLMRKYPQIKGFVATSCMTGAGIDELRAQIEYQLATLNHLYNVLPFPWWVVKQELETTQRDYLTHIQFQETCVTEGMTDPLVQQVLLRLINDLGTVLSYHDDPQLAEIIVLNPAWLTNAVYTLLNHLPLREQHSGMITDAEIIRVVSRLGNRYPSTICSSIIDIMERFELCFRLEGGQWLIPDLLPREEPDTGTWDDALHFIYRYPVLPSSIIWRFVVRSQHAIVGKLHWRNGVVLQSGENRARVKADLEDARIEIRISGDLVNRRHLLSAIRDTFDQIHASLAGLWLEIQEIVMLPGSVDRPVDYQELLGLEAIGVQDYVPPQLRQHFSVSELLDVYESKSRRQSQRDTIAIKWFQKIPSNSIPDATYDLPALQYNIPNLILFTGHAKETLAVGRFFKARPHPQVCVILGMAGIGKSSFARDIVYRYGSYFLGGIFWISCSQGKNHIQNQLVECAKGMNLETAGLNAEVNVQRVLNEWQKEVPKLIIFDDCQQPSDLDDFLPNGGGGYVLITSRYQTRGWKDRSHTIVELGQLTNTESIKLLQSLAPHLSKTESAQISTVLGNYPFALTLAGHYLDEYVIPVKEYLAEIETALTDHESLVGEGGFVEELPAGQLTSIMAMFEVCYLQLKSQTNHAEEVASVLQRLRYCAANSPLPVELLIGTLKRPRGIDAVSDVINAGLLEGNANSSVRMHGLVAAYLTSKETDEAANQAAQDAVESLLLAWAVAANDNEDIATFGAFAPHVAAAATRALGRTDERAGEICFEWNRYSDLMSRPDEARIYAQQAVSIAQGLPNLDLWIQAKWLNGLGVAYLHLQQAQPAQELFGQALAMIKDLSWHENVQKVILHESVLNNLGIVYDEFFGDFDKAQEYYRQALEICQQYLPENHVHIARSYNNLGAILYMQQQWSQSFEYYERALQIYRQHYKLPHIRIAYIYFNIGEVKEQINSISESIEYFNKAAEIFTQLYTTDANPYTQIAQNNIARLRIEGDRESLSSNTLRIA